MWDIPVIDPHRETVGQRRSRKHANLIASSSSSANVSRRSSVLSSNSSERQQKKPTLLGLFGSNSFPSNKTKPAQQRVNSASELIPTDHDEKVVEAASWGNQLRKARSEDSQAESEPTELSLNSQINAHCEPEIEQSISTEFSDSIFSGWTDESVRTKSTWSTTIPPESSEINAQVMKSNSTGSKKVKPTTLPREMGTTFDVMGSLFGLEPIDSSKTRRKHSTATTAEKAHSPAGWKPPETWGSALKENQKKSKKDAALKPQKDLENLRLNDLKISSALDISYIKRYIKIIEAANAETVYARLTENWNMVSDASIYREIELEKQLLMLTAIRSIDRPPKKKSSGKSFSGNERVLSLYENYASSSTISALTTAKEVHHLAISPLPPEDFPNVEPRAVVVPETQLPYPVNYFISITAFSLPYIFPASSIPEILKECRRLLVSPLIPVSPTLPAIFNSYSRSKPSKPTPGGSLHLTIIDPAPIQATIGPQLRAWLDTYLMINLNRQFRCTLPSRLIPVWLADIGLNGEGSTNIHVRFYASVVNTIPPSGNSNSNSNNTKGDSFGNDEHISLKMKSIVGRMLWKEVWGSFVLGKNWWWEDENIIKECERLGTCWEYSVIEAFKGR